MDDDKLLIYPKHYFIEVFDYEKVFNHLEVHDVNHEGQVFFNIMDGVLRDFWRIKDNTIGHSHNRITNNLPSVRLVSEGDVLAEVERFMDSQGIPRFRINNYDRGVSIQTLSPIDMRERERILQEHLKRKALEQMNKSPDNPEEKVVEEPENESF